MTAILHSLTHVTALGPVWVVLLTLIGLPIANEIVQRSPARAQSLLQLVAHFILTVPGIGEIVAKFPVVGDIFSPQDKTGIPKPLLYRPKTKALQSPPDPPTVAALLPFFILPFIAIVACAHIKSVAINFSKCEIGDVPTAITSIIPDVSTALGGGSPNWESDLDAIGLKVGEDAVTCAVASVLHEIVTAHADVNAVGRLKAERAQIYLNKHRGMSR